MAAWAGVTAAPGATALCSVGDREGVSPEVAMTILSLVPPLSVLSLELSPLSLEQPANKPTDIMPASNKLMARSFLFLIVFHLINYFQQKLCLGRIILYTLHTIFHHLKFVTKL